MLQQEKGLAVSNYSIWPALHITIKLADRKVYYFAIPNLAKLPSSSRLLGEAEAAVAAAHN
jgi:hypothetical protein